MTPTRIRRGRLGLSGIALAAMLTLAAACSAEDQVNDALKDSGVNGNVSLDGQLPAGFPKDVPTPDLKLETGIALEGINTLRYTAKDAEGDVADYKGAITEAGFTITSDFNNLAESASGNVGFVAENDTWRVDVSAFGPNAPGGGNYLAVVVSPVS